MSELAIIERFWVKVNKTPTCWLWTAGKGSQGYGAFSATGGTQVKAHRFAYELIRGPIPEGLVLDHLCRTPACVNPDHLEPVTNGENVRRGMGMMALNGRKTHCKRGHEFTEENIYWVIRDGEIAGRNCRTCLREVKHQRYLRRKAARQQAKVAAA